MITMVTTQTTMAQVSADNAIKWRIAAELPAEPGMQHALGVAGPVTGVHHNKLLVTGGANFPVAMPWLGGAKKYYNTGWFEYVNKVWWKFRRMGDWCWVRDLL